LWKIWERAWGDLSGAVNWFDVIVPTVQLVVFSTLSAQ
jgi:hypothetical protein